MKDLIILIAFVALGVAILWFLMLGTVRHQPPMSLQVPIGDDCVHRDESFLFKPNSDAVSAPSQASEKNQAMDRLMAGRDMAPEDFSALMRRLHADGKQDNIFKGQTLYIQNFADVAYLA